MSSLEELHQLTLKVGLESCEWSSCIVEVVNVRCAIPYSLSDMRATIILQMAEGLNCQRPRDTKANAPVEIVEERQEIKPELEETLRFVTRQCSKDLCRIIHMILVSDPVNRARLAEA